MANPKNKRLSQRDRDIIATFARKRIKETENSETLDAAYNSAADVVARLCCEKFPPREMKVLAKYDCAWADACVYVSIGGDGDYRRFEFRDGDKRIPFRPSRNCRQHPILVDGKDGEALVAFFAAAEAYDKAITTRWNDFRSLIYTCGSFNALAETWPAVEDLRGEIVGHHAALSTLSDEVVSRIKADPAMQVQA